MPDGLRIMFAPDGDRGFRGRKSLDSSRHRARPQPNHLHRLAKSASFAHLPMIAKAPPLVTIKGNSSAEDITAPVDSVIDVSSPDSSGWTTPSDEMGPAVVTLNHVSAELEKISHLAVAEVESSSDQCSSTDDASATEPDAVDQEHALELAPVTPQVRRRTSFVQKLSRRMSSFSSRSPSPAKIDAPRQHVEKLGPSADNGPRLLRKRSIQQVSALKGQLITHSSSQATAPRVSLAVANEIPKRQTNDNRRSSINITRNLIKSLSSDRLFSATAKASEQISPVPASRPLEPETANRGSLYLPKRRDELWMIFRQLDTDYARFVAKSTALKAAIVRQTLLPFLHSHAHTQSKQHLRPDDLERRVSILNKWWVGLIDLIHGKNHQSLAGTDRPTILDALIGIMERAEWRAHPSLFCPMTDRAKAVALPRTTSTASLASETSELMTDTIMHSIRNTFVQNINEQMVFVVEKMSFRNASASLVAFCGKTIAYAFCFSPGMAEALVQLWNLDAVLIKRVVAEYNVPRTESLPAAAAQIGQCFPPALQGLGFTSVLKTTRTLRQNEALPPHVARLQWYGFWFDRWRGRESDLFYAFVQQYFLLAKDYLPADPDNKSQLVAPAMVLVQAQLLKNIVGIMCPDTESSEGSEQSPQSFDDMLENPDAVLSTVPVASPDAARALADSRLVMLLRDFLSSPTPDHRGAQDMFAASVSRLLCATAKRTPMYSPHDCSSLCDLLHESLPILVQYQNMPGSVFTVDWAFWIDVFKKMMATQQAQIQTRLLVFLYTFWDHLETDESAKDIFNDFILEPTTFYSAFTHWSPLVRGCFMRLLCWRLGRSDGTASDQDARILYTLFDRLKQSWSYHLHTLLQCELDPSLPFPSTVPHQILAGRRFVIMRMDADSSASAPAGAFLTFNGVMPSMSVGPTTNLGSMQQRCLTTSAPTGRPISIASSDSDGLADDVDTSSIRGFLKGVFAPASRKRSPPKTDRSLAANSSTASNGLTARTKAAARLSQLGPPQSESGVEVVAEGTATISATPRLRFRFSLEAGSRFGPQPSRHQQQQEARPLHPPRLPHPAMKFVVDTRGRVPTILAQKPAADSTVLLKYVGRALGEWSAVLAEFQGFADRRRAEGVASDAEVETPMLANVDAGKGHR